MRWTHILTALLMALAPVLSTLHAMPSMAVASPHPHPADNRPACCALTGLAASMHARGAGVDRGQPGRAGHDMAACAASCCDESQRCSTTGDCAACDCSCLNFDKPVPVLPAATALTLDGAASRTPITNGRGHWTPLAFDPPPPR